MRLTTIFYSAAIATVFSLSASFTTTKTSKTNKDGDWFFLEDKKVGFGVDHDVIHFGNWREVKAG